MAGLASPFDLLPDEVLAQILCLVGKREAAYVSSQAPNTHLKHFIWAKSTCKRWHAAGYLVKSADWLFSYEDAVLSLANFLQHEAVSLSTLRLYATNLHRVPYKLVFTNAFKKSIPHVLSVTLLPQQPGPEASVQELLHLLLSCPSLRDLSILCFGFPRYRLILKPTLGVSHVQKLYLTGLVVAKSNLDDVLKFCPHLTELRLVSLAASGEWDEFDLDSETLVKLVVHFTTALPKICTINAPALVVLDTSMETLILNTSSLETLCMPLTDSEVIFTAPVELQNLGLRNVSTEGWDLVKSLVGMPNCALKRLELDGDLRDLKEASVPFLELLEVIPAGLDTLLLSKSFFEGIRCDISDDLLLPAYPAVTGLTIEFVNLKVQLPSLFTLRKLRKLSPI